MRRLERNRARAEEEESVFVTMTDMTISFLLIIMILLAFFATQLNSEDTVPISAYERVRQENRDLRASVEALEVELARATSELNLITDERDRLIEQNKALQDQIVELEQEIERLKREIEDLKMPNPLEAYLAEAIQQRREILVELRDRLLIECKHPPKAAAELY